MHAEGEKEAIGQVALFVCLLFDFVYATSFFCRFLFFFFFIFVLNVKAVLWQSAHVPSDF